MFRVFLDKARVLARLLKRLHEEFAEAQQHLVPAWLALAVVSGSYRWI